MVRQVIVTLQMEEYVEDYELEANVSIRDLSVKILDLLKLRYPAKFHNTDKIYLLYEGVRLNDNTTLAEEAIWDGSILEIRRV